MYNFYNQILIERVPSSKICLFYILCVYIGVEKKCIEGFDFLKIFDFRDLKVIYNTNIARIKN